MPRQPVQVFLRALLGIGSLLFVAGSSCSSSPPPSPPSPDAPQIGLSLMASGLTSPVGLVSAGDGRLFIIDQIGQIRVIDAAGNLLTQPLLDVSNQMVSLSPFYDERGLLGMALHPDYASNGRFFVVYNVPVQQGDPAGYDSRWRLAEFTVSAGDINQADPNSEVVLLEIPKPQSNHNAGQLAFGPDGYLYASIGDGGGANDTAAGHTPGLGNGQDTTNLLGAILRYDVSTAGTLAIPPDNPFVGNDAVLDAIYAYGLRNAWRFSFDTGGAQRLFCGDVGQDLYEEVNIIEAGGNYGWNIKEGNICFDPDDPGTPAATCSDTGARGEALIDPIIAYSHTAPDGSHRESVIGGYVYRGSAMPKLVGTYIFGDWSTSGSTPDGTVFVAAEDAGGSWSFEVANITTGTNGRIGRFVLAFGQDSSGELYILTSRSTGPSGTTGEVLKIVPSS